MLEHCQSTARALLVHQQCTNEKGKLLEDDFDPWL